MTHSLKLNTFASLILCTASTAQDFGPQLTLSDTADGARAIVTVDVDGDDDLDVIATSDQGGLVFWFENTDGLGTFGTAEMIGAFPGLQHLDAADIDGDDDIDVIISARVADTFAWYENTDGLGTFSAANVVSSNSDGAQAVIAVDVDGDDDVDIVGSTSVDDSVEWFENTDGLGTFGPKQTISSTVDSVGQIVASDLDGDGDLDLLIAEGSLDRVSWFESTDGAGTFSVEQVITTAVDEPGSVAAVDLDDDGDLDVISTSFQDDKIAWYENTDGVGTFGVQQVITTNLDGPAARSLCLADIDGDCRDDILVTALLNDEVVFIGNLGAGSFASPQTVSTMGDLPRQCTVGDINDDGTLDLLVTWAVSDTIAWRENITVPAPPSLTQLGAALAGTNGNPVLTGTGCLATDTPTAINLADALENTTSFLIIGLSPVNAPLKGGVLVPALDITLALPTDANGNVALDVVLSGDIPVGIDLFMQFWIPDPAGVQGFAASNAVMGTTIH